MNRSEALAYAAALAAEAPADLVADLREALRDLVIRGVMAETGRQLAAGKQIDLVAAVEKTLAVVAAMISDDLASAHEAALKAAARADATEAN